MTKTVDLWYNNFTQDGIKKYYLYDLEIADAFAGKARKKHVGYSIKDFIAVPSAINTSYAVLPTMRDQGNGRLVRVGTNAAKLGKSGLTISAAGKGVNAFLKAVAREIADR